MILRKFISAIGAAILFFISIAACVNHPSMEKIDNFTLIDYNGKKHSLSDYKDSKAIVIIFVATECPVSNAYNSRMENLYKEYSPKNIEFLGINSNKAETVEMMKEHAVENDLTFTILKDANNIVADEFDASVTPEVYVLDDDYNVLYHGRIDNSKNEAEVTSKDLENVLNEILAGKEVTTKATKAFGCSIKRV
ncbi:MAG TPA: thioredoxin family protein [Ignavibacteriaceae bacterium]